MSGLDQILMIPGIGGGGAPSYDADYQAILDRGTTLGYTLPSVAQRTKQNTLLAAMKSAGIWTKLDALWIFANDGSQEFATLNWKNPSANQCTLVSSPTFQSNQGFLGDGVAAHVSTNFNCATNGVNWTLNNAGHFVWCYSNPSMAVPHCGVAGTAVNQIFAQNALVHRINQGTTNLSASVDMAGTGLRAVHRTSSTNVELFANTTQFSRTAASSSVVSDTQLLLRRQALYANNGLSLYGIGASLVAENTSLYSSLNTYLTSL